MNADELKKADEIVRAMRDYASDCDDCSDCLYCDFACVCGKFDYNAPKIIADLIESLTAQLTDYHHMSKLVDGKMAENQRLRRINETLQAQLTASQRREKAAVEDLEAILALACAAEVEGICNYCSDDGENCTGTTGWRGPQAEKGEAHETNL